MNWEIIQSVQQFNELQSASEQSEGVLIIFKHSTRCSISSTVLNRLKSSSSALFSDKTVYLIDVISNRELSNYAATQLGVEHESPQLLVIKNGLLAQDTSHMGISSSWLENALKSS